VLLHTCPDAVTLSISISLPTPVVFLTPLAHGSLHKLLFVPNGPSALLCLLACISLQVVIHLSTWQVLDRVATCNSKGAGPDVCGGLCEIMRLLWWVRVASLQYYFFAHVQSYGIFYLSTLSFHGVRLVLKTSKGHLSVSEYTQVLIKELHCTQTALVSAV